MIDHYDDDDVDSTKGGGEIVESGVIMMSTMTKVPGKSPEAAFLNKAGEEVERVVMTGMTRYQLSN